MAYPPASSSDNGAAYCAHTLQAICTRLGIHLIFCRPFSPTSKGRLERWHGVQLDALFHRRISRFVRKDRTVSYLGERFEVPCELSGQAVRLVVDPHTERVVGVEDAAGQSLGQATALDAMANILRVRRKPKPAQMTSRQRTGPNLVELAHARYHGVKGDGSKMGD